MAVNSDLRKTLQLSASIPGIAVKRLPKNLGKISQTFGIHANDMKEVNEQLGYNPTNLIEISARSEEGKPAVVKVFLCWQRELPLAQYLCWHSPLI